MKTLPLLCILACSWAKGEISPKPNVVFQSVVLGKKPEPEEEGGDDCHGYTTLNDLNMVVRRIIHGLYPHSTRYKRDDSNYSGMEGFDDKTIDRLLEILDELKQDAEKNPEDTKEREEEARKSHLDLTCRRGGKWQRKIEECQERRRKSDIESYKKLKDNLEDFLAENKDLEKRFKKLASRKKDWKEELERRRLKESLAESWPRPPEERLPEDMYFPMSYHHQPSHQRAYPTGGYLP